MKRPSPSSLSDAAPAAPEPAQRSFVWRAPAGVPRVPLRAAVEEFLRERGIPYIAVDEARKVLFGGARLRPFHVVVYRTPGPNWLVFAAAVRRDTRAGLRQCEGVFGPAFVAVVATRGKDGAFKFRTLANERVELP